jgi:hypothetical protein
MTATRRRFFLTMLTELGRYIFNCRNVPRFYWQEWTAGMLSDDLFTSLFAGGPTLNMVLMCQGAGVNSLQAIQGTPVATCHVFVLHVGSASFFNLLFPFKTSNSIYLLKIDRRATTWENVRGIIIFFFFFYKLI